jgi:serine/threonine protein kinase
MFIIGRVASGMNYVHEYRDGNGTHLGLVHRDLSPENVLIDRFGRIKVADFGITKAARDIRLTEANPGKLLYASPEQLTGGTLDARSDIYNIGLLMYLMMTNEDRFGPERNLPRARDRILRKMQRSVLGDLSHVDPRLAQMCEACLRVDPGKRYQTCEDLVTDIDIYFKDTGKVLTNEILEETLQDTFSADPKFVSRRFIALTGSPHLEQQGYEPRPGTPPENAPDDPALSTVDISPDPTT